MDCDGMIRWAVVVVENMVVGRKCGGAGNQEIREKSVR